MSTKLVKSLRDAAQSLDTIAKLGGLALWPGTDIPTNLRTPADIRAYAASRSMVAANGLAELIDAAGRTELSQEKIEAIAEGLIRSMPGGIRGFCVTWGWQQFARELIDAYHEEFLRQFERSPLEQDDLKHLPGYRAGYDDGRRACLKFQEPLSADQRQRLRAVLEEAAGAPGKAFALPADVVQVLRAYCGIGDAPLSASGKAVAR